MDINSRMNSLVLLGEVLFNKMKNSELNVEIQRACNKNIFFTPEFVTLALEKTIEKLQEETLKQWINPYLENFTPHSKTLAIIMAGNIPLVGVDDFLAGFLGGFHLKVKLSSKDDILLPLLIKELIQIDSCISKFISLENGILTPFDALIATGSNQSSVYFEHYFSKYPHIIRKSRTSVAILSGEESQEDLFLLAHDIFLYFGMGCRNVSKLYFPQGYCLEKLQAAFALYSYFENIPSYQNNYDYQKSLKLINREPFLEISPALVVENSSFATPISVIHYQYYSKEEDVKTLYLSHKDQLQCVVGNFEGCIPFGKAQSPALWDYADQTNTLEFLKKILGV